jgi:hypothetical protein
VLLRLAYFGLPNTFALLRLLPTTDRIRDTEILVLRHQIAVLHGNSLADRALLTALLHHSLVSGRAVHSHISHRRTLHCGWLPRNFHRPERHRTTNRS